MTGTQTGGVVVLALITMSLLATAASWRSTGVINWRNLVTSVGIGLLGVAFVVGSGRPLLFSALIALSLILVIVTLVVRFV